MKMNVNKSADGTNILQDISDILKKTNEKLGSADESTNQTETQNKTILGLKAGTFYIILILTGITVAYFTYNYISKNKNNK